MNQGFDSIRFDSIVEMNFGKAIWTVKKSNAGKSIDSRSEERKVLGSRRHQSTSRSHPTTQEERSRSNEIPTFRNRNRQHHMHRRGKNGAKVQKKGGSRSSCSSSQGHHAKSRRGPKPNRTEHNGGKERKAKQVEQVKEENG